MPNQYHLPPTLIACFEDIHQSPPNPNLLFDLPPTNATVNAIIYTGSKFGVVWSSACGPGRGSYQRRRWASGRRLCSPVMEQPQNDQQPQQNVVQESQAGSSQGKSDE
ncbi:uncharacterized protein DS421_14g460330 [Arachis hypogaea]|nr:uncharacterized protein DS421_14g460330 [Arachis hypogaea]